jgi:inhibitor of KinA sporulation pathway (predicted exonuclease)
MTNFRILFDLECTCWDVDKAPDQLTALQWAHKQDNQMETIQIGAVKFHPKTFDVEDTFVAHVKPRLNPVLTDFCTGLTGILQSDVDKANPFIAVYTDFMKWSEDCQLFMAWGAFDYRQLSDDCRRVDIRCFPQRKYMNAKQLYTYFTGVRGAGLGTRMKSHGLTFEGRQHDALDDAINTVRLLKAAWIDF